jgi:hypothetical protein
MAADDYREHLVAVELVTARSMALLARIERDQMLTDVRIQLALEAIEESRRLLSALDGSKPGDFVGQELVRSSSATPTDD